MSQEHPPTRWSGRAYLRLLGSILGVVAVLAAIGAAIAAARDDGSLPAVLAALGATGLASALSGLVIALRGGPPTAMLNRSLVAMLTRLVLVAALAALAVLVLEVARRPFLIWLVASYLALLAVDTVFSVRGAKPPAASL